MTVQLVEHLAEMIISIDCDGCDQFAEVLRKIWILISEPNKLASFNYIGNRRGIQRIERPARLPENPLSNLGLSVVVSGASVDQFLIPYSDYRDPCFYVEDRLILAASSDHILIFTIASEEFITQLGLGDRIQREDTARIEDL